LNTALRAVDTIRIGNNEWLIYLSLIISLALIYGIGKMNLGAERKYEYKAFGEDMANAGDMTKSVPRSHCH